VILAAALFAFATAPPPLRSLRYDVQITVGNVRTVQRNGAYGYETNHEQVPAAAEGRGTISIDVIAATADAGLVVDISEEAMSRSRGKIRVAIRGDGALLYDARGLAPITEEEDALLRLLARDFYGEHPTAPGTTWSVDLGGESVRGVARFGVVSAEGTDVTLSYHTELRVSGAHAFDALRDGRLVYDRRLAVPRSLVYRGESRAGGASSAYDFTDVSVQLTLRSDSFAERK
jgi:hypothetical protein